MNRQELFEEWQANNDRPAWVRNRREEIHEHTDTSDEIPNGSLFEVRQWLQSYKGTVTRQLNDDEDGTDPSDDAENTTTADAEQGE